MSDNRSTSSANRDAVAGAIGKASDDPVMEAPSTAESSGSQRERGLDSMFNQLEIEEEEFDDFVIDEDDVNIVESTRWLAVARVHCPKRFSHEAFM
jgi:hypothetical protein